MVFEEWRKNRREKEIDRLNHELDQLKERGLEFEKTTPSGRRMKINPVAVLVPSKKGVFLLILAILFAAGWASTYFIYDDKVTSLQQDVTQLNLQITTKATEISSLSNHVANLTKQLTEQNQSKSELNDEIEDLEDLHVELEKDIKDLEIKITTLNLNITVQNSLLTSYKNCIKDDDGPINKSLSVCDKYL
jgi:predicted  nucleic acid-binding Zn-ribbon protein